MEIDSQRRFNGIQKLYGESDATKIVESHVTVIGIGGVGSWVVESLARSAVGELTLIDLDHIAESNINRQIHALSTTLGQSKISAMADRIELINPTCKVNLIDDHLSKENIIDVIPNDCNYIVDCIDEFRVKAALINYCKQNKLKMICVGGAGGRVDPTCIKVADITRAEGDALLARTRKELRTVFGFSRNLRRRFDIPCVYSTESLRYPTENNEITTSKSACSTISGLNCANGFGSISSVTASFAMIATAHVLNKIAAS